MLLEWVGLNGLKALNGVKMVMHTGMFHKPAFV
jgi:hypothetical protein